MDIIRIFKDFVILLGNEIVATSFSVIIFILLFLIKRNIWGYLFAILVSYLIAHLISTLFITGGSGIVQIPSTGSTHTRNMGHGYLAFLSSIIIGTFSSSVIADAFTKWVNDSNLPLVVILSNTILAILVFIDFHVTFYNRN